MNSPPVCVSEDLSTKKKAANANAFTASRMTWLTATLLSIAAAQKKSRPNARLVSAKILSEDG